MRGLFCTAQWSCTKCDARFRVGRQLPSELHAAGRARPALTQSARKAMLAGTSVTGSARDVGRSISVHKVAKAAVFDDVALQLNVLPSSPRGCWSSRG